MVQKKEKSITERKPGPKRKPQLDNPLLRRLERHPAREILEATATSTSEIQSQSSPESAASRTPAAASKLAVLSIPAASNLAAGSTSGYPQTEGAASRTIKRTKCRHYKPQLNCRIDSQILENIKIFCIKKNLTLTEFIEHAASRILEQGAASLLAHDDMMMFKTHEDIIMRYETYTLQKWAQRDDRDGERYNQADLRLLDIAFISTIEKKLRGNTAKQPIKSFNYFTQEIDLLLEQQKCGELPTALDEYHKYVLSTWEKRIRKIRDEKWSAT